MKHFEIERALARVCLEHRASETDLAMLGGRRDRWLLYRSMVRNRFWESIRAGLPRTIPLVGEAEFRSAFDAFLSASPPRTRLIRFVTSEFVQFVAARWEANSVIAPFTLDLARFESALLDVLYAQRLPDPSTLGEFDTARSCLVTPAFRRLDVGWSVHLSTPEAIPCRLLVYRDERTSRAETLVLSTTAAQLLHEIAERRASVEDAIRTVITRNGDAHPDAGLLESVATLLDDFITRGIILGSQNVTHAQRPGYSA